MTNGPACVILCFAVCVAILLSFPDGGYGQTHLDKSKLPDGCSSCHKGHGKRATVMLDSPKDEICFKCHGSTGGRGRGAAQDIRSVIIKRSNHPVIQTSQYHVTGEVFPERSPSTPRHVSCFDCHNVHLGTKQEPYKGVRGYSGKGVVVKGVRSEYEVCYRCHSDSANRPADSPNMAELFSPGNASYHPVEAAGRNRRVPSLKPPLSTASTIVCSDCHGNDDKVGPKGPHGSIHEGMLRYNYSREPAPESPYTYEACYVCHERTSILNDESFKSHKRHVVYGNSSCHSCHDPHGSRSFDNLIVFDRRVVFPNSMGQVAYLKLGPGKPRCLLTCHVSGQRFEHKLTAGQYCINANCPPGW